MRCFRVAEWFGRSDAVEDARGEDDGDDGRLIACANLTGTETLNISSVHAQKVVKCAKRAVSASSFPTVTLTYFNEVILMKLFSIVLPVFKVFL